MRVICRNEPDAVNVLVLTIDFLLYFILGFLIFFIGPLFILIFLSRKNKGEVSQTEMDIITYIFDSKKGNTAGWLIGAIFFGVALALVLITRKIKKRHLVYLELNDEFLLLGSQNLKGEKSVQELNLQESRFSIQIIKGTEESDPIFELKELNSGRILLSTLKSKYWDYKYDIKKLLSFREEMEKRELLD